jgi:hypothetical protein
VIDRAARDVLWAHTDQDSDTGRLMGGPTLDGDPRPGMIAHLVIGPESVDLDRDAVRRLGNACNRLAGVPAPPTAPEALHAVQHQQLEAAARRFAEHVDEQANALARIAGQTQEASATPEAADVDHVAELVHLLAVQQQRTTASLGDLLSAIAGEP